MLKIRKQAAAMESLQNGSAVTLESQVMGGKRKEIKGKGEEAWSHPRVLGRIAVGRRKPECLCL